MTTPTEILNKLFELMKLKNSDYGNSFMNSLERFNLIAAIVRISDKIERLVSLNSKTAEEINFESLKDTYEDLLNYCLMTVVYIKYGLLDEKKFPEYYEIIKNEVEDYYNSDVKEIEYISMNIDITELFNIFITNYHHIFNLPYSQLIEAGEVKNNDVCIYLFNIINMCLCKLKYFD